MNPRTEDNQSKISHMVLALDKAGMADRDQYNFFEDIVLKI